MRFDPMTGKPIEDDEEEISFDPMTGQPIRKKPEPAQQGPVTGFDPMTGKPIIGSPVTNQQESAPQGAPTGFDPMTGKPITGSPVTNQQGFAPQGTPTGFDPMTGKPITGSPITGGTNTAKLPKAKNSKLPIIIGAAVLGIAAVAGIVWLVISSGLLLGKQGKILVAINNTAKKAPRIVEALEPLESIGSGKYTVSFSGDIEGVSFEGEFRNGGKEKQVSGKVDVDGDKLEMLAGIDSKAVKLSVPALTKYVLTYNYTGKNSGYITDAADEEDINAINGFCEALAKETDAKKIQSDVLKVYADEFKSLKFESVDKKEYTIDEKDVKCAGYKTVITGDNLVNIVDGYQKVIEKQFDFMNDSETLGMYNLTDSFDELRAQCEDVDEIEVTFYLYKNQLAAIALMDAESEEVVEICLEGGDYRLQNIRIKAGENQVRLKGKTTDTKETFTLEEKYGLKGSWNEIASLEYTFESGKFTISADGSTIKGNVTGSASEVTIKISEISSYYYNVSPSITFTAKKGAKMEKFDGKEFDMGNADEGEWEDLQSDVYDNIADEDLGSLLDALNIDF